MKNKEATLNLDVLTKDQAARVDRIKSYHAGCLKAFSDQMGYAYLAGAELLALKEETPHGKFEELKKTQFPEISRSSLGRYMDFADALKAKYPTVGYLEPAKLLTNGSFDQKAQAKVLEAVHDVADGKTLTQLYRDLGVIRPAQRPTGNGRKTKDITTTILEADGEDTDLLKDIRADVRLLTLPEDTTLAKCEAQELLQFKDELKALLDRVTETLAKRRKSAAAK